MCPEGSKPGCEMKLKMLAEAASGLSVFSVPSTVSDKDQVPWIFADCADSYN